MSSQADLRRYIEATGLSYFIVHLRWGMYFDIGYFSAVKGVEHITEELEYASHAKEVIHILDQGRLPPALALILACDEVAATNDIFTDGGNYYCIKVYDYRRLNFESEKIIIKWMVVRWITEDDIPCHLNLYPNHAPILKDDPCMGVDDSQFFAHVMSNDWFQRNLVKHHRQATRRKEDCREDSRWLNDLALVRQASEGQRASVARLASTRRTVLSQKNLLDNSQQAFTRDLKTDFPVPLPDNVRQTETPEWPTEFTMEPYVELELFIHPPARSPSKLHLFVSRRMPDQKFFAKFRSEDPSQPGSPRMSATSEYTTGLGSRNCSLDDFLRQYTELVTDRGRYPAQVILKYAGQEPTIYKEYPFFFEGHRGDLLDVSKVTQKSSANPGVIGDDPSSGPLSVG